MSTDRVVARRVHGRSFARIAGVAIALVIALGGVTANPEPVRAATIKVVVIVGPVEGQTASYLSKGRAIAARARSHGAKVYEVYSPNATFARVRQVAQGANLLVYLGHGNGWPSPYSPTPTTKNGLGLNATAGHGHYNLKYYGEGYLLKYIRLAPNAVVILNHLCYASGNSEPGRAKPTLSVARRRVDNFASAFLRIGARTVFAEAHNDVSYIVDALFKTNKTMLEIFWSSPRVTRTYRTTFRSTEITWSTSWLDPSAPGAYYRAVTGRLTMRASAWR